jgi:hypothetical protein
MGKVAAESATDGIDTRMRFSTIAPPRALFPGSHVASGGARSDRLRGCSSRPTKHAGALPRRERRSPVNEREAIERYFAAFNRHDLDGVLACFHQDAIIVGNDGSLYDGLDAVRSLYAEQFAITPDGRCHLRTVAGADGHGEAESLFEGTRARDGRHFRAIGLERFTFLDGRIKEVHMRHRPER